LTFESGSKLHRIPESAFFGNGLQSINIPANIENLGKSRFSGCNSLKSVRFESELKLQRIEEIAFLRVACKASTFLRVLKSYVNHAFQNATHLNPLYWNQDRSCNELKDMHFVELP
jgi:hypothetical protein